MTHRDDLRSTPLPLPPCPGCPNRRMVLKTTGTGLALAVLAAGCGSADPAGEPSGPVQAGNASLVAVGTLRAVSSNLILGRDAGGLYAMTAVCTHQGCAVNVVGNSGQQTLLCPCHASTFNNSGAVTRGPAQRPLQHYQVDIAADGTITIQGSQPVASSARTAVA